MAYTEKKELISRTIVNGMIKEDIHLTSETKNGKTILKGNINNRPILVIRPHSKKAKSNKTVRFMDNIESVSNQIERMPTPFEPVIKYKTNRKKKTRKNKRTRKNRKQKGSK
jgi:adenylate kinase family enzyme